MFVNWPVIEPVYVEIHRVVECPVCSTTHACTERRIVDSRLRDAPYTRIQDAPRTVKRAA
jgi:hypothetical protein